MYNNSNYYLSLLTSFKKERNALCIVFKRFSSFPGHQHTEGLECNYIIMYDCRLFAHAIILKMGVYF